MAIVGSARVEPTATGGAPTARRSLLSRIVSFVGEAWWHVLVAAAGERVSTFLVTGPLLNALLIAIAAGTLPFFSPWFTSYGALFGAFDAVLISYQDTLVRVLGGFTILLGDPVAPGARHPEHPRRRRCLPAAPRLNPLTLTTS